jgi:hypothetical protein
VIEQSNTNEVRGLRLIHRQETDEDGTSCGLANPSPQSFNAVAGVKPPSRDPVPPSFHARRFFASYRSRIPWVNATPLIAGNHGRAFHRGPAQTTS